MNINRLNADFARYALEKNEEKVKEVTLQSMIPSEFKAKKDKISFVVKSVLTPFAGCEFNVSGKMAVKDKKITVNKLHGTVNSKVKKVFKTFKANKKERKEFLKAVIQQTKSAAIQYAEEHAPKKLQKKIAKK